MAKRPLGGSGLINKEAEHQSADRVTNKSGQYNVSVNFESSIDHDDTEVDNTKGALKTGRSSDKAEKVQWQANGNFDTSTPTTNGEQDSRAAKKARKTERAALKLMKEKTNQETVSKSPAVTFPSAMIGYGPTYMENSDLSALPRTQIDSFLLENFISIADPAPTRNIIRPITKFSYLPAVGFAELSAFKAYKDPTPIQAAAWPYLLAGRDVIGVAETGSGKTMAFAIPCVRYIMSVGEKQKPQGVRAVVVSPTRELAMQSYEQLRKLASSAGLEAVCVYGGVPKEDQRKALCTANIVVATPGRLNDLISEGSADLSNVGYIVLDEADRMLDKGFEDDIRKIIGRVQPLGQRQTLMFTATWPESVRSLAASFMTSPVKIAIGDNPTGDLRANARIVQKVEVVDPRNKEYRLLQLLKQYQNGAQKNDRILVFCLYKKEATRVESFIRTKGIRVTAIHGDLSQEQRTRSLDAFKQGLTPVLVATDVAARGLDIPSVKLVINCTFPLTVEDYVHRIGRTGRAGKEGLAITLFTEYDKAHSGALINVLKGANQPVPDELLKFGTTVKKKSHDAYGVFFKDISTTKTATKIKFD